MKIYTRNQQKPDSKPKITAFEKHWTHGLNRRSFIKGTVAASLLASIAACKPSAKDTANNVNVKVNYTFSKNV